MATTKILGLEINALSSSYADTAQTVLGSVTSASYATTSSYFKTPYGGTISDDGAANNVYYTAGRHIITASNSITIAALNDINFSQGTAQFTNAPSLPNTLYNITSSRATSAITASYALTAQTLLGSVTSASYATTSSYALTAQTLLGSVTSASYATTSSFALQVSASPAAGSTRVALLGASAGTEGTVYYDHNGITYDATTNKLTVSGPIQATSFTGSLLGTASYATQALSASYAPSSGGGGDTTAIEAQFYFLM
jgi:hypothetical protein